MTLAFRAMRTPSLTITCARRALVSGRPGAHPLDMSRAKRCPRVSFNPPAQQTETTVPPLVTRHCGQPRMTREVSTEFAAPRSFMIAACEPAYALIMRCGGPMPSPMAVDMGPPAMSWRSGDRGCNSCVACGSWTKMGALDEHAQPRAACAVARANEAVPAADISSTTTNPQTLTGLRANLAQNERYFAHHARSFAEIAKCARPWANERPPSANNCAKITP